jgi:ADP-ribose pyrophosphatase YjhB (NUDIX family)
MSFLRLGVACAVMDDEGRVLLSRRGDLNVWNLPGGRLDSGELLQDAAAREVREETGVIAQIDRPVGLYFWANWARLNVLYTAWPLGGDLQQRTVETRANQYFAPEDVPDMPWSIMALDALAGTRHKPRMNSAKSAPNWHGVTCITSCAGSLNRVFRALLFALSGSSGMKRTAVC